LRVKYHFVPKKEVVYCLETESVAQAAQKMKESGYRCIPVLSKDELKFAGLVYKVDVLEYLYEQNGTESSPVTSIIEDGHAYVLERDSFFRAFYTIRRLPFLAVLNDYHQFVGILTHSNVFDVIEDSFGMNTGGYTLTIATHDNKGTIKELGTILKNYNIGGLLTIDNGDQYVRRIIVNITDELTEEQLGKLIAKIEKKDFRISHVDRI
jgi:CBS domain containing-hemolysin-like protein